MSSRCVLQWILVPSLADANVLYNRTKWTVPNNEVYFLCLIILPYSHSLYHRLSRNGMVYTAETDVATAQMNVQWASVMGHRLPSRQSNSLLGSTGFFQSADISTVEEAPLSRKKIAIRMGWDGIPPNTIEYDWNFRCLRATPPSLYFDCCNCCIWYWSIVNATWLETVLYSRARWWCQKTVRRPKNWHFRQKVPTFGY